MVKSPLRYPGGKTRSAEFITSFFPEFDEYREPFVGGASVFLLLKEKFPKKKFWINDIYDELYTFLNVCRYNPNGLIQLIRIIHGKERKDGKELFEACKQVISASKDKVFKAAAFFIINRISFSGTTLSGGYSDTAFKKRFTVSCIDRLEEFCKALKPKLKITHYDYSKLLQRKGNNVFIYCDPPYYTAEKSALYGKNGNLHKGFDHERFAQEMKACQHKWCISYDNCDYIRNLYDGYRIVEFESSYGMKNVNPDKIQQKGKEILIFNY